MPNDPEILQPSLEASREEKKDGRSSRLYPVRSHLTEIKAVRAALELSQIRDGEQILEVAAGTGLFFRELLRRNPNGRNTALDLSPRRLYQALKRFRRSGIKPAFVLGSAQELPIRPGQFDLLISNYLLDLLPEDMFPQVLSEFKRVLKPGGRVVITTMAFGEKWFNRVWVGLAKWTPGLLAGCRPVSMAPHFRDAGFSNIKVIKISQNTFPSQVLSAESAGHSDNS